jgi:hypothetical protein
MGIDNKRQTSVAVVDVRKVWPQATMVRRTRIDGLPEFNIHKFRPMNVDQSDGWIACGDTPKEAWWKARERALAHALSRD